MLSIYVIYNNVRVKGRSTVSPRQASQCLPESPCAAPLGDDLFFAFTPSIHPYGVLSCISTTVIKKGKWKKRNAKTKTGSMKRRQFHQNTLM